MRDVAARSAGAAFAAGADAAATKTATEPIDRGDEQRQVAARQGRDELVELLVDGLEPRRLRVVRDRLVDDAVTRPTAASPPTITTTAAADRGHEVAHARVRRHRGVEQEHEPDRDRGHRDEHLHRERGAHGDAR